MAYPGTFLSWGTFLSFKLCLRGELYCHTRPTLLPATRTVFHELSAHGVEWFRTKTLQYFQEANHPLRYCQKPFHKLNTLRFTYALYHFQIVFRTEYFPKIDVGCPWCIAYLPLIVPQHLPFLQISTTGDMLNSPMFQKKAGKSFSLLTPC